VLLPKGGAAAYEHRYGTPTVTIGGRAFPAKAWENFYSDILPAQVRLPKGWQFAVYEAKIPLSAVARKFDASIHYVQPNFPGHIAGYVPIHPPEPAGKSKIVFVPANDHPASSRPSAARWSESSSRRRIKNSSPRALSPGSPGRKKPAIC
jgi:hypothetical protein